MKQGDIVIVRFPFADSSQQKTRPAVVLSNGTYNKHHNVLLAGIYTKPRPCAVALFNAHLVKQKLQKESHISLQNVFSLHKDLVDTVIDSLTSKARAELIKKFKSYC